MTLGEFGLVTLRENVPGIFLPLRTSGCQLVHVPGSKPHAISTVFACDEVLASIHKRDPYGSRCSQW